MAVGIRLLVMTPALARRLKLPVAPAHAVHGHPTFGEAVMEAAAAVRK
jgi:hypothetical protein